MSQSKRKTTEDYLIHLENKGIEKGYFNIYELKDIDKSCCLIATTKVIDFDKTKEKLVAIDGLITTKSCDCLKICPKKQCIDLIEIKGFTKFIEYFKGIKVSEMVSAKIEKYDLQGKIEDSLRLLDIIVLKQELDRTIEDVQFFRDTKINYILLTDVDSINQSFNYIALNFIFYAQYSDSLETHITSKLSEELANIPLISHKLNKPMLKTCSEIDAFYL
jgi:hypothetical protein